MHPRGGRSIWAALLFRFIDGAAGKPVGTLEHIGRRPTSALGTSDGDLQMLEWVTAGARARFGMVVRHDDPAREWAYDRESPVGRLDAALDAAGPKGWTVVSMRRDWKRVSPAAPRRAEGAGNATGDSRAGETR